MQKKRVTTFQFPKNPTEKQLADANIFINHWYPLSCHIAINLMKHMNFSDYNLCQSVAYEACYRAFIIDEKINDKKYLHQKGIVRKCTKWTFYTTLIINGKTPSSGQIFFPKDFVYWEDYFNHKSTPPSLNSMDFNLIKSKFNILHPRQEKILNLYLKGYN